MRLENLNLGKPLSKDEQKKIKGGTTLCNAGQYAYCACASGNFCVLITADGESTGAACQTYCNAGPVSGHTQCYGGSSSPACPG